MSDAGKKDFVAGISSDQRRSPVRVAFVTRRTSAQVKAHGEEIVQSFPEVLFRAAIAVELLAIMLVLVSLIFNAPLEGLADATHTPNPAKAPWYFLGLQELLHYFPPVVAGVLVPTLVVIALIVIPYFNINIEAEGLFTKDLRLFGLIEGSAEEAHAAIEGLTTMLEAPEGEHSRDAVVMGQMREAQGREKAFAQDLKYYLSKAMTPPLEREDIEALSNALYKIPKTAEKFAERYLISGPAAQRVDFSHHLRLLAPARPPPDERASAPGGASSRAPTTAAD